MAAASSSSVRPHGKYEVFISFRGEDTRQNFVSHLYAALRQKKIETYMDERLERGDKISNALLEAIEESKISIIVFSRNYANSSWCLDELVHILKCNEKNGQVIIPIFYHVDPSHVRKQQESYANAFAEHDKRFKDTLVHQWRVALTTVANLSGWDSSVIRPESTLIEKVVYDILKKLNRLSPAEDLEVLVGINKRIEQVKTLLGIGLQDILTLGVWGMAGIGKTTLVRVLYNQLYTQFESCCFLANVREESIKHGLNYLEEKIVAQLLEETNPSMVNPFSKDSLRRKKVLIVLDDVNDLEQLEHLVGHHDRFGSGSRIIVTTRDRQLLKNRAHIYEVEALDFDESHQLFISNAFGDYSLNMDLEYAWLTERVLNYVGGNPLACKIMGSHLRAQSKAKWESVLKKLKEVPRRLDNLLRISYDGLDERRKEIFLDIACFFKGLNQDYVRRILDGGGFDAIDIEIEDLIDKSLITIEDNNIWMHDLVQEMGHRIVRQESELPGKRSRLWNAQDVYHVLENNSGTEAIKGIFLDMSKTREVSLAPTVFQKMGNLRILHIFNSDDRENCKISLPQGLQMLPNTLRSLRWDAYPLSYLPSNFTGENLVELVMAHSQLEQLRNDVMNFSNLRTLDLSKSLIQIPDLSKASNLEILNIDGCRTQVVLPALPTSIRYLNLRDTEINVLPETLGSLLNLEKLALSGCKNLTSLLICNFRNLKALDLSGCTELKIIPEFLEPLNLLTDLQLNRTAIKEIQAYLIENLAGLQYLNLDMCKDLELIPSSIQNMTSLQGITLRGCSKLKVLAKLPSCLRYLDTHGCTSLKIVLSSRTTLRKDCAEYELLGGRFVFYGCYKLEQNVRHIIMAEAQLRIFARAITSSKLSRDRSAAVSSFSVCCPGNTLPNWLKYQSRGSSISIKLSQDWSNKNFLGFALCAVLNNKDSSGFDGDLNLVCRIRCITDNNDYLSWESCSVWGDRLPSLGCGRWGLCSDFNWGSNGSDDRISNSGHVFFWDDYSHRMLVNNMNEKGEMNPSATSYNVTKASFEFICVDKNRECLEGWNVDKCAVHFLYRQDAREFHKTTTVMPSRL